MVIPDIGEMNDVKNSKNMEDSHMQLAFAILLREKFQWVNDIVVYDCVLSFVDRRSINQLDCTCLSVNEQGRRTVDRPTLFCMPHCPIALYENVLEANWTSLNLNKIIILGNSFNNHTQYHLDYFNAKRVKAIRNSDYVLHEFPLPEITKESIREACPSDPSESSLVVYFRAFQSLSWHFFAWDGSLDDLNLHLSSKDYAKET